jgi:hypothetical protein
MGAGTKHGREGRIVNHFVGQKKEDNQNIVPNRNGPTMIFSHTL